MDSDRVRWVTFILLLALIFTTALSLGLYRAYSGEKEPSSALSVRSTFW